MKIKNYLSRDSILTIEAIFFIVIPVLLLTLCESKKGSIDKTLSDNSIPKEYFPLKKGNKWVYKTLNYFHPTKVEVIDENIDFNGKKYFKIETVRIREDDSSDNKGNISLQKKDGVRFVTNEYLRSDDNFYYIYDEQLNTESIFLPKMLENRHEWFSKDSLYKSTLVNIDSTLNTPNAKYQNLTCLKISKFSTDKKIMISTFYAYYKKGLGLVGITYSTDTKVAPYYLDEVSIN